MTTNRKIKDSRERETDKKKIKENGENSQDKKREKEIHYFMLC